MLRSRHGATVASLAWVPARADSKTGEDGAGFLPERAERMVSRCVYAALGGVYACIYEDRYASASGMKTFVFLRHSYAWRCLGMSEVAGAPPVHVSLFGHDGGLRVMEV